MKKVFIALSASMLCITATTTGQVKFPAPSPTQTVKQDFGLGNIELVYSRPAAKGRKVFGDLVPFGKLWRTGANGATRLHFSEPVEIGGKKLDSGAYALYTIPGEDTWEIILNKGVKNSGTDGYKESDDVVRFKATPVGVKGKTESFTMQFANIKPESCELQLLWEGKMVPVLITTNVKEKIRAQIDAAMLTSKKPYWQAAQFYNEFDKNLPKALENVNKATEENPKAFWMFLYKARIEKELGNNTAAMETSKTSLTLAKEAKNDDYVRMNEKLQQEIKKGK